METYNNTLKPYPTQRQWISSSETAFNKYLRIVYLYMALGLITSGVVSYICSHSDFYTDLMREMFISPIILAIVLTTANFLNEHISKLDLIGAEICFLFYSIFIGSTLAGIFHYFTDASMISIYFELAASFLLICIYSLLATKPLTRFGVFLGLNGCGIMIAVIINFATTFSISNIFISALGILIISALTLFEIKHIKAHYYTLSYNNMNKRPIVGALYVYIGFIVFFLKFLGLSRSNDLKQLRTNSD